MFKTLEELKEKFPIGTVYRRIFQEIKNYYYNENDKQAYSAIYYRVRILDNNVCLCTEKIEYKVDGYLFDGTSWYPAKQTWDGWEPIDEDEINVGGF